MDIQKVKYHKGKPYIFIKGKKGMDRQYGVISNCIVCNKKIFTAHYRINPTGNVCSGICAGRKYKGNKSPKWKGGKWLWKTGYIMVTKPDGHPDKRRYIAEHRLIIEKQIGRYLKPSEFVHHLNGLKTDNRKENLALCTRQNHFDFIKRLQERIRQLENKE